MAQKQRTKTELSLKQSTVLVQNCCKSFISMVTYLRDVFSDECYEVTEYCGTRFRVIKENGGSGKDSAQAQQMLDYVTGDVYKMIEEGVLEHLMLAVYDTKTDDLLEQYLMKISRQRISFQKKGNKKFSVLKSNIERNFSAIVRSIHALSETQKLLPASGVYVKLVAVLAEDAPREMDTQLNNFSSSKVGSLKDLKFPKHVKSDTLNLGTIETSHHTIAIKLRVKEDDLDGFYSDDEEEEDEQVKVEEQRQQQQQQQRRHEQKQKDEQSQSCHDDSDFESQSLRNNIKKRKKSSSSTTHRKKSKAASVSFLNHVDSSRAAPKMRRSQKLREQRLSQQSK